MFRALRHRNFRLFAAGQLVSLMGSWMQTVAQGWLIYSLTHSAWMLGLSGFLGQAPGFLASPWGGWAADRWKRRNVVLASQAAAMLLAFALAAVTLLGVVQVWHILLLAGLLGVVSAFDIPARQSLFIELVGPEDLSGAIALNSSVFNIARVAGPALAGVIVAWVGEGWCFLLNGISFLAVLWGLLSMNLDTLAPVPSKATVWDGIREGFSYAFAHPQIRAAVILMFFVGLVGLPYVVLMPLITDKVLGAGSGGFGFLMSMAGVGALAGALALAARRTKGGLEVWIARAGWGFGVLLTAFALSRIFWVSAVILVGMGFCVMIQMAGCNTMIQSEVPNRLRGRIMAIYSMVFLGAGPLGSLLVGALAGLWGAPWTLAGSGLLCLAAATAFSRADLGSSPATTLESP